MDREAIAKRLVELRGSKTQKEVAEALEICQSTYAMYESGKRMPSDEKKKRIAEYFKRSVQSIFFK
jgi:transcriptional regulator with XRE-family HTH domain